MSAATLVFANLGAEEGAGWTRMAAHPRVRAIARLFAALFRAGARCVGPGAPPAPVLAAALAKGAAEPALPFLAPPAPALFPWLATREAAELARAHGVALGVAQPEVALAVHDKAFAQRAARQLGLVPGELADAAFALEPDALADADTARCRIEAAIAGWPEPLRARFALKPRFGTSGRGRVSGRDGALDRAAFAGALERLRARGGVWVEPWLERTLDLSAQLHVAAADDVRVLGTLRQVVSAHGVPLGHAGRLARDGSVTSGTRWDGELRDAALALGRAAAAAGFSGVCGVDAFVFRDARGAERLRPIVELNARFTAGTVALGLLRRACAAGLCAGRESFQLGFELPDGPGTERLSLLADDPQVGLTFTTRGSAP